ncbi:FHA domain-containing protein [Microbacterium sp. MC2]
MVDVRFQPAAQAEAWRAVVSGHSVAVLPPSTTAHTAESVWRRLADGGIAALIEGLTGAFGTSLSAIPPFAFATVEEGGVRVAVRGSLELIVESGDGTEAVSGAGVATWVERLIPDTYRVTITVDGSGDGAEALPLIDGVVPVAGLVLVTGPVPPVSSAPAAAVEAAPAVVSEPVDAGGDAAGDGAQPGVATDTGAPAAAPSGAIDADDPDPARADAPDSEAEPSIAATVEGGDAGTEADAAASSAPPVSPFLGSRWSADDEDEDGADSTGTDAPGTGADVIASVPGAASDDASAGPAEPASPPTESVPAAASDQADAGGHPVPDAAAETWLPAATAVPPSDEDIVFGATVARPSAAGAPASTPAASSTPVPPMPPVPPVPPLPELGDHDGATIAVSELRKLREAEREKYESTENVPPRQPSRGRIRLSTGRTVELERPVVIGRRPKSARASGDELPTLVAVDSPNQDISRSHIEIRAEGEHVLVTDLNTTNGTVLLRAGNDPVRLHPGEPTLVVDADVLDLGDGVTLTFEDLP